MVDGETLRESESRLRFLFDNAVLGIFQTTPEGAVLSVNPAFARMFGYDSPDEVLRSVGSAREFYVDGTDRRRVLDAVLTGPGWGKFEVRYRRRDGSSFTSILHIWGARDEAGRIIRFEGFVEDISERRQAQEELKESQRRLADIIDFLPDATMVIDAEGRVTAWNRAMEEMTGVKAGEIIGRGDHAYAVPFYGEQRPILIDLVMRPSEEIEGEKYSHLQRKGGVLTGQGHITNLGGGDLYFVGNATALRDSAGNVVGAIETVRDVTERTFLEVDLRAAKDAAEGANRAKSAFLANMSHEIRTPMNAILGFSQILRDSPALTPELREHVDVISRSGEHLLALINDILEMSKIEAGQAKVNLATLDLDALIRDVQLMFELRVRSKGLGFEVVQAPDLPRFVTSDESKLRQILINLLGNAIKFTDRGAVILRADTQGDDRIVFSVEDTGPGIDEDERSNLFRPFSQARAGLATGGGTGLGLAISREFACLLEGDLRVESESGVGSVFTVEVRAPAADPPEPTTTRDRRRVVGVAASAGRPRILVVDDKDTNRDLLRAMLTPLGFRRSRGRQRCGGTRGLRRLVARPRADGSGHAGDGRLRSDAPPAGNGGGPQDADHRGHRERVRGGPAAGARRGRRRVSAQADPPARPARAAAGAARSRAGLRRRVGPGRSQCSRRGRRQAGRHSPTAARTAPAGGPRCRPGGPHGARRGGRGPRPRRGREPARPGRSVRVRADRGSVPRGAERMSGSRDAAGSQADILVVDDTPANLKLITEMLTARGYGVRPVPSGELALKVIGFRPPDLILLDITMPGLSGYEVCRRLKENPATAAIPVIFLSALQETDDKVRAFAEGGVDFITKPFQIEEVEARVSTHLRLRELQLQLERANQELEVRNRFIREAFGRYMSDELATELLRDPAALELGGQHRRVTVLMADLRGFSCLADELPAESVVALLNIFLGVMAEVIITYGGMIDEFIGDAILAIFGAPVQRPDDARRAVSCAVAMQLAMPEVNRQTLAHGLPEVSMGIGVSTGEVVAGNIGCEKRTKYGVVGRPVVLAARIEGATTGGQVLIADATFHEAADVVEVHRRLTLDLKGMSSPAKVHEVVAIAGDDRLRLPPAGAPCRPLEEPQAVEIQPVEGHVLSPAACSAGHIVGRSRDRVEVETARAFSVGDTVRLRLAGVDNADIYGRVCDAKPNFFRLAVSYRSPGAVARLGDEPVAGE